MEINILKIASDTSNMKKLNYFTHSAKTRNPMCGDNIVFKINLKKNFVKDVGYESKSCIYCQASASLLSKISINKKKSKINELCDDAKSFFDGNSDIIKKKWKLMQKLFKSKNKVRKECILLPFKTVQKIVSD